ncbi:MAG: methyltransferase domain-containing protein [Bacteroidota bacterium]
MEYLSSCPICKSTMLKSHLTCKDYTVSQSEFTIVNCSSCGFTFTNPRPEPENLGVYYKSEEYVSHSNTKKGLIFKLYQLVRNYTLDNKVRLVKKWGNPKNLLDIGCGTGAFIDRCAKSKIEVVGIEPDESARNFAINNFSLNVFDESEIIKIADNSYDTITMWHVLEHVSDLEERVKQLKRILKPGGTLFVALPNMASYDAQVYGKFWAAYDVPRHLYHFKKGDVERLFNLVSMVVVKRLPMKFDSFYVSMLSEKYLSGKVNYFKAFYNGMKSNKYASKSDVNFSSVIYILKNSN